MKERWREVGRWKLPSTPLHILNYFFRSTPLSVQRTRWISNFYFVPMQYKGLTPSVPGHSRPPGPPARPAGAGHPQSKKWSNGVHTQLNLKLVVEYLLASRRYALSIGSIVVSWRWSGSIRGHHFSHNTYTIYSPYTATFTVLVYLAPQLIILLLPDNYTD